MWYLLFKQHPNVIVEHNTYNTPGKIFSLLSSATASLNDRETNTV